MKTCGCRLGHCWVPAKGLSDLDKPLVVEYARLLEQDLVRMRNENKAMLKLIEECAESAYARVACLEWVRKHKKCSKP